MNKPLLCEVHGVEDQRPIGWPRCPFCKPPEQPPRCVAVEVGEGNTTAQCVKPSGHAGNHSNGTFDFMDPIDRDYPEVNETPPGWKVAATPRVDDEVPAPEEVWVLVHHSGEIEAHIPTLAMPSLESAEEQHRAVPSWNIVRYVRAREGGR